MFQPKPISADRLQELLTFAWRTCYHAESQGMKMSNLFQQVMRKEKVDGTFRPRNRAMAQQAFGRPA